LETAQNDDGTFQASNGFSQHNKNVPHHRKRLITVRNVESKVDSQNSKFHQKRFEDFMTAQRMSPDTPS